MTIEQVKFWVDNVFDSYDDKLNKDEIVEAKSIVNMSIDAMAIKALEQQPCEDAISRQEVLDQAVDYGSNTYLIPVNSVKTLPSVTPKEKTGHWIRVTDKSEHLVWECNKCGWQQRFNTNFCPNCGARMQEVEENG